MAAVRTPGSRTGRGGQGPGSVAAPGRSWTEPVCEAGPGPADAGPRTGLASPISPQPPAWQLETPGAAPRTPGSGEGPQLRAGRFEGAGTCAHSLARSFLCGCWGCASPEHVPGVGAGCQVTVSAAPTGSVAAVARAGPGQQEGWAGGGERVRRPGPGQPRGGSSGACSTDRSPAARRGREARGAGAVGGPAARAGARREAAIPPLCQAGEGRGEGGARWSPLAALRSFPRRIARGNVSQQQPRAVFSLVV